MPADGGKKMGRPALPESERLRHAITLRFNDAQWAYLWFWDRSAGDVVRELIDAELDSDKWSKMLEDGTTVPVHLRQEVLENPPAPEDIINRLEQSGPDSMEPDEPWEGQGL